MSDILRHRSHSMEQKGVDMVSGMVFIFAFLVFAVHMIWPDTITRFSFLAMYFVYLMECIKR